MIFLYRKVTKFVFIWFIDTILFFQFGKNAVGEGEDGSGEGPDIVATGSIAGKPETRTRNAMVCFKI